MSDERQEMESLARRHLHWCLAAIILPVISLPLEWFVAYGHRRLSETIPEHRRWSHRILGLALVDTIVAGVVIALFASGVWGWHTLTDRRAESRSAEPLRIGVTFAPSSAKHDDVRIATVARDSPAEHAGLQPGDVLVSIDGKLIETMEDARAMIRRGVPGVPRNLRIRRGSEGLNITVTPERRPAIADAARATLNATPTSSCLTNAVSYARAFFRWTGFWAAGLLMMILWLAGRRVRPHAPPLWSWVFAALCSVIVAGPFTWWVVCLSSGGRSVGAELVAELTQSVAALAVALIAMRHMTGQGLLTAQLGPLLGTGQATALGFFYLVTINIRLTILESAVEAVADVQIPSGAVAAGELAALGWPGVILRFLTVAVIGPIEEEVLFRGVVLPRLVPWMGPAWAIVASSVVFAVLHEGYGTEPFGLRAVSVLLIALILGWARLRTGGLSAPITMHITTNTLSLLASFGRHS